MCLALLIILEGRVRVEGPKLRLFPKSRFQTGKEIYEYGEEWTAMELLI